MNDDERKALGQQIENRNPYSFLQETPPKAMPPASSMQLQGGAPTTSNPTPPWVLDIEEDTYVESSWQFRGRTLQIAKAIRIPYNYKDEWGNLVREYLVIGYEGGEGE